MRIAIEMQSGLEENDSFHREKDTLSAFFGYISGSENFMPSYSKKMTTVAHG